MNILGQFNKAVFCDEQNLCSWCLMFHEFIQNQPFCDPVHQLTMFPRYVNKEL